MYLPFTMDLFYFVLCAFAPSVFTFYISHREARRPVDLQCKLQEGGQASRRPTVTMAVGIGSSLALLPPFFHASTGSSAPARDF